MMFRQHQYCLLMALLHMYRKQRRRRHMLCTLMMAMSVLEQKRKHRFWVHDIIQKKKEFGVYYHLVRELEIDSEKFHEYFRMSSEKMEFVLNCIGPFINKRAIVRQPIDAKQRLAITIR